ncbi:hypothetical protein RCH14_000164 [Massilia sp. MP_M2]|uniref:hypothetical protein n=1 Tax=Massilia sp. MP_M2 TaxID=3071713 RepID=UPI00319E5158
MNKNNAILAMLLALAAAGASAQTTGATQGQPTTGETYRPSLDGQQTATPAAPIDMQPKTQEEKATGRQEPSRLKDIDPATHPAPQNVRPQPTPAPKTQQEQGVQPVARRSVQQQIDSAGRLASPNATTVVSPATTGPATTAPATSAPTPVVPTTSQVSPCIGATCTDATGATTAGAVGSSSVNSAGRLCNRSGTTVQCF